MNSFTFCTYEFIFSMNSSVQNKWIHLIVVRAKLELWARSANCEEAPSREGEARDTVIMGASRRRWHCDNGRFAPSLTPGSNLTLAGNLTKHWFLTRSIRKKEARVALADTVTYYLTILHTRQYQKNAKMNSLNYLTFFLSWTHYCAI